MDGVKPQSGELEWLPPLLDHRSTFVLVERRAWQPAGVRLFGCALGEHGSGVWRQSISAQSIEPHIPRSVCFCMDSSELFGGRLVRICAAQGYHRHHNE